MSGQRYKAVLAYDGTAFCGWQIQPDQPTLQGACEAALAQLTGEKVRVQCCGRTDAGVHARGQAMHFDLQHPRPPPQLLRSLNAVLPDAIRILKLGKVSEDFHARFSAVAKEYRYFIWNTPIADPFRRLYSYQVKDELDIAAMREAARHLEGTQDFAAFSANPNREINGTVRELYRLRISRRGHEICISALGNGFLYRMVRSLAGFLIRVGRGELPPAAAQAILASRLRTARVPTAPGHGLFLWKIHWVPTKAMAPGSASPHPPG